MTRYSVRIQYEHTGSRTYTFHTFDMAWATFKSLRTAPYVLLAVFEPTTAAPRLALLDTFIDSLFPVEV